MPSANPTARALRALDAISSHPGITATELGAALDVTERAARRYVQTLRDADIPIESVRGPYGGYRLGRGLRLPPLVFSATEALGLVMATLDGHHAAADPDDPVGSALGKIIRALPEAVGWPAATMRANAVAAPDRHRPRPDPAITAALVAAVAASQRVTVDYHARPDRSWRTDVDPWAVVVRHGRWYLLCHSHAAGAIRTYRVDRIASVEPGGETFSPPADLDPVALLEEHLGSGWEFETRVVFDAPIEELRHWVGGPMGRLEAIDADHTRLTGSTSNALAYAGEWLAGIPFPFHVEGGPELITATRELAAKLAAAAHTAQ